LVALAVCAGAIFPIAGSPGTACAGEGPRAALVVDTGESVTRLCVKLGDDSVSGLELIELASQQHGLDYGLGFGGGAVCMLAGIGPTGDDCFEDYPDFWGYWRGTPGGEWTWSNTGAGATTIEDGDVDGWAWGSGDGPDSHPQPPPTEFADVCAERKPQGADEPEPSPSPPPAPSPTPAGNRTADAPDAGRGGGRTSAPSPPVPPARDRRFYEGALVAEAPAPTPSPPPTPTPIPSPAPSRLAAGQSPDEGPPPAGIAALVGTLCLAAAAAALTARRR
jgi:hypothetical protein